MKYVTTIAVVGGPVLRQVQRIAVSAKPTATSRAYQARLFSKKQPTSGTPRLMEGVLWSALDENVDCVCFFRALLDGWDAPHRNLLPWFQKNRPSATSSWKRFIKMGFLILLPRTGRLFLPRPRAGDLRALYAQFRLEDYALAAYLAALYDGLTFQAATRLPLVLTARCVGPSTGDEEYRGIAPGPRRS